ncbi:hypothetical protein [Sorangium sp. So ce362]|uniref:hypothetical protein n=1 Tax=Sorangium sp. So ce362 TaxID=3133303 RepID=UPI003F5FC6E3
MLDFEEAFGGILSSPDETALTLGTFQALSRQRSSAPAARPAHSARVEISQEPRKVHLSGARSARTPRNDTKST